ncbi:hypothetical protein PHLGIDRAFT_116875 [Phlebiopsis gigantea 11061_1 CR5-6]|uniref:Uncharacterized protein n=1 Tax=Phlebiopsis gigantea (strain 11061_1 CR5-6) TaxID=745531 RepID=A0A0C3SA45_PHLG1|nr:hypothetical protein PHLGIDRAFT_116875 [Phlebiopsis gigantea 11061_1 CR5-6]
MPSLLDALHNDPIYRLTKNDVIIWLDFESITSDELCAAAAVEAASVDFLDAILTLLSPTIHSFTLSHSSSDLHHPCLKVDRVLRDHSFSSLTNLVLRGSSSTTKYYNLPLSPSFAPLLRTLEIPSDMLNKDLSDRVPAMFPRLSQFAVNPLRPGCTIAQLHALLDIGVFLGVFYPANDLFDLAFEVSCSTPPPRTAGASVGSPPLPSDKFVDVTAPVEAVPDQSRRREELRRFEQVVSSRVAAGMQNNLRICVKEALQERVPTMALVSQLLSRLDGSSVKHSVSLCFPVSTLLCDSPNSQRDKWRCSLDVPAATVAAHAMRNIDRGVDSGIGN